MEKEKGKEMTTVDFVTFCNPRDIERLSAPNELRNRILSHRFLFDKCYVIKQRCRDTHPGIHFDAGRLNIIEIDSEDHPNILTEFNIPEEDLIADTYTHGPTAPHYWQYHTINHLIGLKVSTARYVVFSDSDCRMLPNTLNDSWVQVGIGILERYPEVLIVSPGDGGDIHERKLPECRLTKNVSQQLFVCDRECLKYIDFNVQWMKDPANVTEADFYCPGGPAAEYYWLMEGRLWRYMDANDVWRAILPDKYRYWHDMWQPHDQWHT